MNARRLPIGAEPLEGRGVHFRVWAPGRRRVAVVERSARSDGQGRRHELAREEGGYFSGVVSSLAVGALYSYALDDDNWSYPDPASRFQPEGVHGPSQVIDPRFAWTDDGFKKPFSDARVIYELHIGTFTREGTFEAARQQLAELRKLGVTTLEIMPVAAFPGRFGWGYDGVTLFAPMAAYGTPDDLRRLIDTAHQHGLAVILDVVYNHLGPDGNYLKAFSPHYFTDRYENEWGEPLNFDGAHSAPVREFFVSNAAYWITEFHFDGLRLDATQSIFDASETHVIADIAAATREAGRALGKQTYIVAENEPQQTLVVRSRERGGYGCDALWNDDFHHTARVALTGHHEAYYADYRGSAQELISALKWGYLYQGQHYSWQKKRRGTTALDLPAKNFVTYVQNHDQIANSAGGLRLDRLTSPGELRAMTALMLLAPPTPMLFQGQEFAASTPFLYFADHKEELREVIRHSRREFLQQFPSIRHPLVAERLPHPNHDSTFERCKLDFGERERHRPMYDLHCDLLALRHGDPAFRAQRSDSMQGAVIGERALALRFFCEEGDRLLIVNLGCDLMPVPAPEPLIACGGDAYWKVIFGTEDPKYGGCGFADAWKDGSFQILGRSAYAFVLTPIEKAERAEE